MPLLKCRNLQNALDKSPTEPSSIKVWEGGREKGVGGRVDLPDIVK